MGKKDDPPDTSIFRPANILHMVVSNSTSFIGWNDDDFRKLLEDRRKLEAEWKSKQTEESTDDHGNQRTFQSIDETGFGLHGILNDAVQRYVDKMMGENWKVDLKTDLKQFEGNTRSKAAAALHEEKKSEQSENKFKIREMKLYQNLLSMIKYQRDAYIMGSDHADMRKQQRESLEKRKQNKYDTTDGPTNSSITPANSSFPFGAMVHHNMQHFNTYQQFLNDKPTIPQTMTPASGQLNNLLTWFIPSPVMHNSLLPTVLWTIALQSRDLPQGGPLTRQIVRATCDLIPLSQHLLDQSMKSSIIWVLRNRERRDHVKGTIASTSGLTGNMQMDEQPNSSAGSGRFVTTKTVTWHEE
mmetsp:Transcript_25041/g.30817  ORF Transcript_25041/g.30817 Transcript_25041/m.30817 type:complete len:356 (-) Transcript_25041:84-1151(-)